MLIAGVNLSQGQIRTLRQVLTHSVPHHTWSHVSLQALQRKGCIDGLCNITATGLAFLRGLDGS